MKGPTRLDRFDLAHHRYAGTVKTFSHNDLWKLHDNMWDYEDLEQELMITLWSCVNTYNPDKGAAFNGYFQQACKHRIITIARYAAALRRKAEVISIQGSDIQAILDDLFEQESKSTKKLLQELGAKLISITSPSAEDEALALMQIRELLQSA
jgi:DNA-directed RNA polymerase specialized sigma subunit